MAKLRDLVACLAKELEIPLKSMNVLAMELRKAGLIQTTGRGLNSAEMGPRDATNLILAALCGSFATQSAEAVHTIRAGTSTRCVVGTFNRFPQEMVDPPAIPVFERLPWPHTLGEFLDGYIEDSVEHGDIPLGELCITNMSFSLRRDRLGWCAIVWIDSGSNPGWSIEYVCHHREIADASSDNRLDVARALVADRGSAMRTVTEEVIDGVFFDASLCIRGEYGKELDDDVSDVER